VTAAHLDYFTTILVWINVLVLCGAIKVRAAHILTFCLGILARVQMRLWNGDAVAVDTHAFFSTKNEEPGRASAWIGVTPGAFTFPRIHSVHACDEFGGLDRVRVAAVRKSGAVEPADGISPFDIFYSFECLAGWIFWGSGTECGNWLGTCVASSGNWMVAGAVAVAMNWS